MAGRVSEKMGGEVYGGESLREWGCIPRGEPNPHGAVFLVTRGGRTPGTGTQPCQRFLDPHSDPETSEPKHLQGGTQSVPEPQHRQISVDQRVESVLGKT